MKLSNPKVRLSSDFKKNGLTLRELEDDVVLVVVVVVVVVANAGLLVLELLVLV